MPKKKNEKVQSRGPENGAKQGHAVKKATGKKKSERTERADRVEKPEIAAAMSDQARPAQQGQNKRSATKSERARRSPVTKTEKEIKDRLKNLSSNPLVEVDRAREERKRSDAAAREQHAKKTGKAPVKEPKDPLQTVVVVPENVPAKPQAPVHKRAEKSAKLRVIPLGGIGEIGKNITVLEYGQDILIIDCGVGFPDEDMPGVDLVIPDFSYLEANRDKIRGLVLTHGHEDHVGAVPYLLKSLNIPVYGTRLTLKIVENKLSEFRLPWDPILRCVEAGDTVKLGCFSVEFIRVNHSIADACCLAVSTPVGMVIHSGDFKLDLTPIEGDVMNITRLGELGNKGVLLLLCESTNAERPGYTPSERTVGKSLEYIFTTNPDKRLIISTFSSNVHRVQQVIDSAARHGRKVAITGRSMINIISAAIELGYMNLPRDVLIDVSEVKRYRPSELAVVCTGSQGEPMSALYRMAFDDKAPVSLDGNDVVVISASAIPGNEKLVGRIVNELCRRGVGVVNDPTVGVHVSGHACREELKLMQALTKPQYFMPVHGEYRHLEASRELAAEMGMEDRNVFIPRLGQVLEIDRRFAGFAGSVTAGNVMVDGSGVGEVGEIVLRDRRLLAQDGVIIVFAAVDFEERMIYSKPDVVSRGFVYMRESEELIEEVRIIAGDVLASTLSKRDLDRVTLKTRLRDELAKFIYGRTKRRPMILPVISYL